MPALVEDTRPDPAVEYHQERQQTAYNEVVFHHLQHQRTMALVEKAIKMATRSKDAKPSNASLETRLKDLSLLLRTITIYSQRTKTQAQL